MMNPDSSSSSSAFVKALLFPLFRLLLSTFLDSPFLFLANSVIIPLWRAELVNKDMSTWSYSLVSCPPSSKQSLSMFCGSVYRLSSWLR